MNRTFRILLAFAFLVAIVAIGINGTAWADKLNIGGKAPAAIAPQQGMFAGGRLAGTVIVNPHILKLKNGVPAVAIANCATVSMGDEPAGATYTGSEIPSTGLPAAFPGKLMSCGIQIEVKSSTSSTNLGATADVCFPVPPSAVGLAYYYDGTQWVKTTMDVKNGQSCVQIPSTAVSPTFAGLFG